MSLALIETYEVFEETFGKEKAKKVIEELYQILSRVEENQVRKTDFDEANRRHEERMKELELKIEENRKAIEENRKAIVSLELKLEQTKSELIKWFVGTSIVTMALIVSLIKLL